MTDSEMAAHLRVSKSHIVRMARLPGAPFTDLGLGPKAKRVWNVAETERWVAELSAARAARKSPSTPRVRARRPPTAEPEPAELAALRKQLDRYRCFPSFPSPPRRGRAATPPPDPS